MEVCVIQCCNITDLPVRKDFCVLGVVSSVLEVKPFLLRHFGSHVILHTGVMNCTIQTEGEIYLIEYKLFNL